MIIQPSEIFALWGYFQELLYLTLEPLVHRPVDHIVCRQRRLFLRTNTLSHWSDEINSQIPGLSGVSLVNHVMRLCCCRTQLTRLGLSLDSTNIIYVTEKINAIQNRL